MIEGPSATLSGGESFGDYRRAEGGSDRALDLAVWMMWFGRDCLNDYSELLLAYP